MKFILIINSHHLYFGLDFYQHSERVKAKFGLLFELVDANKPHAVGRDL